MAIIMETNYSKKVGLPGYSSHQYMLTLRTELADLSQVEAESARLHALLQSAVDRELQKVGYLPPAANGDSGGGSRPLTSNGNHHETWGCSPRQRDLLLRLVEEHQLDKNDVEGIAQDRFGKTVKALNRLEASGLLDEIITLTGGTPRNNRRELNGRAKPASAP